MVYAGIDVHRKRSQLCVLEESGAEVMNRNYENSSQEFRDALDDLEPGTKVAFEAAYGWGWLADLLEQCSLEAHLVHPAACKAIASARLKNDKVDARIIAQLLRTDFLPEAWIAPTEVRDRRQLLRHRAALVRTRTSLKNRIHAVLADEGLKAEGEKLWSDQGRSWLAAVALRPAHRQVVDDCCELLEAVAVPIARLDQQIHALARHDPRVPALCVLPGVGELTAMTLLAEIGDISRFATARKLCAWAGLTPTVRNSDRKVHHGHITKAGPAAVRWVLAEASCKARNFPQFEPTFSAVAARRGKPIAGTAVARKLLARCFHILKALEAED
ncbi:MAG TPA: IS110 family transposase [Actinomycetota bacterium]|nr:IS110 family transposase [Actinomycetota bacterium]